MLRVYEEHSEDATAGTRSWLLGRDHSAWNVNSLAL